MKKNCLGRKELVQATLNLHFSILHFLLCLLIHHLHPENQFHSRVHPATDIFLFLRNSHHQCHPVHVFCSHHLVLYFLHDLHFLFLYLLQFSLQSICLSSDMNDDFVVDRSHHRYHHQHHYLHHHCSCNRHLCQHRQHRQYHLQFHNRDNSVVVQNTFLVDLAKT